MHIFLIKNYMRYQPFYSFFEAVKKLVIAMAAVLAIIVTYHYLH